MPKGTKSTPGQIRIAANGYSYTKTKTGAWRLTHHLVAERALGRPLSQGERCFFLDGNRSNLDPKNIGVVSKVQTKESRIVWLKEKIWQYQAELRELENS